MIIIGVDVETTGLEVDDEIIEMGATLFNIERSMVLASFGRIYKTNKWNKELEDCHNIPLEVSSMMKTINETNEDPWDTIDGNLAKYVVAHNASHDFKYITKLWPSFKKIPWLCTQNDIIHGDLIRNVTSKRLGHLAVDYGIPMTQWHRALVDSEICARIASLHNLDLAYARKLLPKFKLSASGGFIKDVKVILDKVPSVLVDNNKYRWDGETKTWWKENLTSEQVEVDAEFIKNATKDCKQKWAFNLTKMDPPSY